LRVWFYIRPDIFLKEAQYLTRLGVAADLFLGKQGPAINDEVKNTLCAGYQSKSLDNMMIV